MTVLESRMPWKIFGPKTDVVTGGGGWRRLHNNELC
jgi:hypothetical protein